MLPALKKLTTALWVVLLILPLTFFVGGCEIDRITQVEIAGDTITVVLRDTVLVNDTIQLPPDTIVIVDTLTVIDTLTFVDTLVVHDTTFVTDTLVVVDTIFVVDTLFVVDTIFVTDTLMIVKDSVSFELSGFITDHDTDRDLGDFTIPDHIAFGVLVVVEIALSGNAQLDEAWALSVDDVFVGPSACPIVPDNPVFGRGEVLLGWSNASGTVEVEARHAKRFSCYPPIDNFRTANSVHFKGLTFIFWRLVR